MQKPSRRKKLYSEHVSIVNLDSAMMTLPFGANIDIHDMVRYKDMMKEYGLGQNGGWVVVVELGALLLQWCQSVNDTPDPRLLQKRC
jgi:hypothetical protein